MTARRARRSFDDGGDSLVPISRTGSMTRDDQEIEMSRPASMSTASSIESEINMDLRKEIEFGLPNYDYMLAAEGVFALLPSSSSPKTYPPHTKPPPPHPVINS